MAQRILVLTGAGISAESGLSTFRDPTGIWARYNPMELATPEAFARDPGRVQEFYNMRRKALREIWPNAAHAALADLEAALARAGGRLDVVTQNIDDLHERAGSKNVIHMHGELLKARCNACGAIADWIEDIAADSTCPECAGADCLRPHVVWFGEIPLQMDVIVKRLEAADLFVSIGTSGSVYPAATYVAQAFALGIPRLELNLEPSAGATLFTDARYGPASKVVPAWAEEIVASVAAS